MQKRQPLRALLLLAVTTMLAAPLYAFAPSGAIFTTLSDGSEVNLNIFPSKEAVYLDGGPGPEHHKRRPGWTTASMFSR